MAIPDKNVVRANSTKATSLVGPSYHSLTSSGVVVASITAGLKALLWQNVMQYLVPADKLALLQEFYNGVYPKWFFNGLRAGVLDPHTFQLQSGRSLVDLVMISDLDYFGRIRGVMVKTLPSVWVETIEPVNIVLNQLHQHQVDSVMTLLASNTGTVADSDAAWWQIRHLQGLYEGLSGNSNFLSVPPVIKQGLVELFGSPFNTSGQYCSAFAVEKESFGSLGSFFDYQLQSETNYLANPPFDETMMADMVVRLGQQLARSDLTNITVIVTIPEWNPPFLARDLLESCRFVKSSCRLTKQKHCYYDYGLNRYIAVCYSRLYVLSNSEWSDNAMTATKLAQRWEAETDQRR